MLPVPPALVQARLQQVRAHDVWRMDVKHTGDAPSLVLQTQTQTKTHEIKVKTTSDDNQAVEVRVMQSVEALRELCVLLHAMLKVPHTHIGPSHIHRSLKVPHTHIPPWHTRAGARHVREQMKHDDN
jgi:hypothetical protein